MDNSLYEAFNAGYLRLLDCEISFADIAWSKHSTFDGVELKHILTAKSTNGKYSYHLVKITPNKCIGEHTHETQLETHKVISGNGVCIMESVRLTYEPSTISIIPAKTPHKVTANEDGLYLFAKFIPALC